MVTGTTASSGDHSIITGRAGDPGRLRRELGQIFGVAGLGKPGPVEHVLGDRIGHDGVGEAGEDVPDREIDGRDRRRRAGSIGMAGRRGDGHADIDHRQRCGEDRRRFSRLACRHLDGRAQALRALRHEIAAADDVERRQIELAPPPPCRDGDVRADPCRFAERQGKRTGHQDITCVRSSPACATPEESAWL